MKESKEQVIALLTAAHDAYKKMAEEQETLYQKILSLLELDDDPSCYMFDYFANDQGTAEECYKYLFENSRGHAHVASIKGHPDNTTEV